MVQVYHYMPILLELAYNNQLNYARVSIMPVQNIYQYPDVAGHNNVAISQSPNPAQGICGACLNYGFSL